MQKVVTFSLSSFLISKSLPSLITVFLSLFSTPHCLYLSHLAHLLRPIWMRPNCCVCFLFAHAARMPVCPLPDSDVCIADFVFSFSFLFGWLQSAHSPNNRFLISCVYLPLLLFFFFLLLLISPHCSVLGRCGKHC